MKPANFPQRQNERRIIACVGLKKKLEAAKKITQPSDTDKKRIKRIQNDIIVLETLISDTKRGIKTKKVRIKQN